MKLFNTLTAFAAFAIGGDVAKMPRARRDTVGFSLSGEENADELLSIMASITQGSVDEIERAIDQLLGPGMRDLSDMQTRKFRNLKILVLWLQEEKMFGRYCYYGCYCLPEGSHNIAAGGYGRPVDGIDQACFDFKQCYKCLVNEHAAEEPDKVWAGHIDSCAGENLGYRADLMTDNDGNKSIVCTNKLGECRRNICECDKALAEKLAFEEKNWDVTKHAVKGGFNREATCSKPVGGGSPFVECCGDTSTFPFNQPRRENQCCDGPLAKPDGTC